MQNGALGRRRSARDCLAKTYLVVNLGRWEVGKKETWKAVQPRKPPPPPRDDWRAGRKSSGERGAEPGRERGK